MSVSKWAYHPEVCDGDYCPGDCDECKKADEAMEASERKEHKTLLDIVREWDEEIDRRGYVN